MPDTKTTSVTDASRPGGASRAMRNITRMPARTVSAIQRTFDPQYWWQVRANLSVPMWLSKSRRDTLYSVPGTSSRREQLLLAYLAKLSPPGGLFVEIGAWKGRSTALLVEVAQRLAVPARVVSIDPHMRDTWGEFQETVKRFDLEARGLEVHRAMSHAVGSSWSRPISFLWVDGSHEYPDVVHDIADFTPHVMPGAYVLFDDAARGYFPGVERALAEWDHTAAGFRSHGAIKRCRLYQRLEK